MTRRLHQLRRGDVPVLIPVYYRAEMGGLQEHVRAQAHGLRQRGFQPVVVCRNGLFAESLGSDGISTITISFEDLDEDTEQVLKRIRPAIVHAHPFRARRLGLMLAERAECPFFVTFHGQHWKADDLSEWGHRTDGLIAVSEGVRDHAISVFPDVAAKVVVLPNAVNLRQYRPGRWKPRRSRQLRVLVPSRFDEDKSRLVNLLITTWRHQIERGQPRITWVLAGDGTRIHDLRDAAAEFQNTPTGSVEFLGWQSQNPLRRLYRIADACVAPGRSALEAMASGTPTFALGSKGYAGPMWSRLHAGMYSNFGGYEAVAIDDALPYDLDKFANLPRDQRASIGTASRAMVAAFYDQRRVDDALAALYRMHLAAR